MRCDTLDKKCMKQDEEGANMKQVFLCLTIGWMCFIFYQGSRQLDESYSQSDVIVDQVMEMIEAIQETFKEKSESTETNQMATPTPGYQVDEATLAKKKFRKDIAYVIRKSAHFFEYGLLATLLAIDFYLIKQSRFNVVIYSLFITLLCAVGDEFYQSFIGRGSNVRDIVIDFSGALFGIACVGAVLGLIKSLKSKSMKSY